MMTPKLTILICTHNRQSLLARVIDSLNSARRPANWQVELFVVPNACTDGSIAFLEQYTAQQEINTTLPLRWVNELTPGKSHALNTAIPHMQDSDIVAFVDDDHRVDEQFLVEICQAADRHPQHALFCGRILPDWDGSEPAWVHEEGPFRIRPLPIPRSDGGPVAKEITLDDPTPGGGNLFIRSEVFRRVGRFSTELGPKGHDLGGGEDSVFIQTALQLGERLMYIPGVLQFHYVDTERLKFSYVLRKAFHRSRSHTAPDADGKGVPKYMWRKLASYAFRTLSTHPATIRFHLVRIATTLGEISAQVQAYRKNVAHAREVRRNFAYLAAMSAMLFFGVFAGTRSDVAAFTVSLLTIAGVAGIFTLLLGVKSIADFSHTGPRLRGEILQHYRGYSLYAFLRLLVFAYIIFCIITAPGVFLYQLGAHIANSHAHSIPLVLSGSLSVLLISFLQFSRVLLHLPACIAASSHYRLSRFYPYWNLLNPTRLNIMTSLIAGVPMLGAIIGVLLLVDAAQYRAASATLSGMLFFTLLFLWLRERNPTPLASTRHPSQPNIIMIGSDTLRADRLDGSYHRNVAPFLNDMAEKGVLFDHCYVPCARTAPSLLAMLTSTWPHSIGVRDNFVADEDARLNLETLPHTLRRNGYYTAALSDWCGADMGKFNLGFDYVDVPDDQWNLKTFIRQGPKDLRLFLSLFARNRFGKHFLPEIYYLGGVPLTDSLGCSSRALISQFSAQEKPFFLNLFFSTTHGPFGSEYPYYTRYAEPSYQGESKFVMARLTDPFEIIRRQGEPKEEFDLDQIIDLYDGCVTRFDDEVRHIMSHLEQCGLSDNTIVVIYSDHGMEFFEHETWGQGNSAISDVSNRIPLLIKTPGASANGMVSKPVRSIDLPATLLDLAGIPVPGSMDGVSLTPFLHDTQAELNLDAFCETGIWLTDLPGMPEDHLRYPNLLELLTVRDKHTGTISLKPEYVNTIIRAKDRMIRSGRWKLVYQPLKNGYILKLFDMDADPGCRIDVFERHPEIANDLWKRLEAWINSDPLQA